MGRVCGLGDGGTIMLGVWGVGKLIDGVLGLEGRVDAWTGGGAV